VSASAVIVATFHSGRLARPDHSNIEATPRSARLIVGTKV
jgi:hypothetical protein